MTWFKLPDKPCLLPKGERIRQIHRRRPTGSYMRPQLGGHASSLLSSTPTPNTIPIGAPSLDQYGSYFSGAFTNPMFFTQAPHYTPTYYASTLSSGIFFAPPPSLAAFYPLPSTTPIYLPLPIIPAFYPQLKPKMQRHSSMKEQDEFEGNDGDENQDQEHDRGEDEND
ncbi:hypothetical protein Goshw_009315 [Gossypium schwendimanii]|uniref:Uncharacterized protein n=1 Tax=Gossypium schwendimanii TaxID=34291 RepID=A0A7J9NBV0_GOSSC|nr:hypothetical protein [Gossypium schwendimanii]